MIPKCLYVLVNEFVLEYWKFDST